MTENQEQAALFEWAAVASGRYPELRLLHAIANGGKRDGRTAAVLQRTGVKPGVPDLCLPVARGEWHGLYIEMKRQDGGQLSQSQREWIRRLYENGYAVAVAHGSNEAWDSLMAYLLQRMPERGVQYAL